MWSYFALLLLAAAATTSENVLEHRFGWQQGHVYHYNVKSLTVTARSLPADKELKYPASGVQIKSDLHLHVLKPRLLMGQLSQSQHARLLEKNVKIDPDSRISEDGLKFHDLPISGRNFMVTLSDSGVIETVHTARNVPVWEVNLIKSIVSQLQFTTKPKDWELTKISMREKEGEMPFLMYKTMEDSVAGNCEALYDVMPPFEAKNHSHVRLPHESDLEHLNVLYVAKTKNYMKCTRRMKHNFGTESPMTTYWMNGVNEPITQVSFSYMTITGDMERFTIQNSRTIHMVHVESFGNRQLRGTVQSLTHLTLMDVQRSNKVKPMSQENLASTQSLAYISAIDISQLQQSQHASRFSSEKLSETHIESRFRRPENNQTVNVLVRPKSELRTAPHNLLISYLMGSDVESLNLRNDKKELKKSAVNLITQIANNLNNPNEIVSEEILELQLNLHKIIRNMDYEQIVEVFQRFLQPSSNASELKELPSEITWDIVRDAVSQAGTGPALLVIKDWIKKGQLKGLEAVKVISELPKVARVPTDNYFKEFFNILQTSAMKKDPQLNVVAVMSFSELLRNVVLSEHNHPENYYGFITNTFKSDFIPMYIRYLEVNLEKAVKEDDSLNIQTYILALGKTGQHHVLPILEPYLERTKPISNFQRLMAISSLETLARIDPVLLRPILYKIYFNVHDDYEVRAMAVHLLIMTKPSLIMLQRLAKFTNVDKNDQVNAVVKSSLDSLANLQDYQWLPLAMTTRMAKQLLTLKKYNSAYSMGHFIEVLNNPIVRGYSLKTIGSLDTDVPKDASFILSTIFDRFGRGSFGAQYGVSNMKNLMDYFKAKFNDGFVYESLTNNKIAEALKLQQEEKVPLEGNVLLNGLHGELFYPFDEKTIREIAKWVENFITHGEKRSSNYMLNSDTEVAFGMESGLPFFHITNFPILTKYKFSSQKKKEDQNNSEFKGKIDVILANKIQNRFGFVAPYEEYQYMSVIDSNTYLRVPLEYKVEINKNLKDRETVKIQLNMDVNDAKEDNSRTRVWHNSLTSLLVYQNVFNFTPVNKNKHKLVLVEPSKTDILLGKKSIKVNVVDKLNGVEKKNAAFYPYLIDLLTTEKKHNHIFDINIYADDSVNHEKVLDFSLTRDISHTESSLPRTEVTENFNVFDEIDTNVNSVSRRDAFHTDLKENVNSADIEVFDIGVEVPALMEGSRHVVTIGVGSSNVDSESRVLAYWNLQESQNGDVKLESCTTGNVQYSKSVPFDLDRIGKSLADVMKFNVKFGNRCKEEQQSHVTVILTQSHKLQRQIIDSEVYRKCKEEAKHGNKGLAACQTSTEQSELKDKLKIMIDTKPASLISNPLFIHYIHPIVKKLGHPEVTKAGVTIWRTPITPIGHVNGVADYLSHIFHASLKRDQQTDITDIDSYLLSSRGNSNAEENSAPEKIRCAIDANKAITFDGKVYPVNIGNCWNVVTIDNLDHSLMIRIRQLDNNVREMNLVLDDERSVVMKKQGDVIETTVNKKIIRLSQDHSYKKVDNNNQQIVVEIFELPDGSAKFISEKYGVEGVFDGHRLLLQVQDEYRASLRGLCGNFDRTKENDFVTPNNCVAKDPKEFVNSYIIPINNCAAKSKEYVCHEKEIPTTQNIISDAEMMISKKRSGNLQNAANVMHATKIMENDNEICISLKPIPQCLPQTEPKFFVEKMVMFHCSPSNESILQMKHRIEKGANVILNDKPVSKRVLMNLPSFCVADMSAE